MHLLRPAAARGQTSLDWLDGRHSFSFGRYHDAEHMGFGTLRVINEDRVLPNGGFATHGHSDMEIITYVVDGELEHKDSLGTGSVIRPGDVQRMTAGTGIRHSEFNPSSKQMLHLLQIWLLPDKLGLTPSYEQKSFPIEERRNRLRLLASRDGRSGSITVHQDADLYGSLLDAGEEQSFRLRPWRQAWLQLIRGELEINGERLEAGDGLGLRDVETINIKAVSDAEMLLFDLAA